MSYGIFIDAEDGMETVIVSIRSQHGNLEGFRTAGKQLRCSNGESARRWVERNFGPVVWCVIDRYTPAKRVAWCVVASTPAAVTAAK